MELLINVLSKEKPAWSSKIDRWYQLDEVSYAFCEALSQWDYLPLAPRPDVIFLALPGASNLADFDFVNSGALSPAKFVYTLPNICAAVIFQMLGFSGKVYCLHKGAQTKEFVEYEAQAAAQNGKTAWMFTTSPLLVNDLRRVGFQVFPATL